MAKGATLIGGAFPFFGGTLGTDAHHIAAGEEAADKDKAAVIFFAAFPTKANYPKNIA